MTEATCAFCQIIGRQIEAPVVYEDEHTLAFLDHRPLFIGHSLVVPKEHYETLSDVPADLLRPLFSTVQLLSRGIEQGLKADGTFVAQNNRVSQSVPHVHIHVIPRKFKDGLRGFFFPRQRYSDAAQMEATAYFITEAIAELKREA